MNILFSHYTSQAFPNGSGGRFVFENLEKKETGPTLTDFEYAKAMTGTELDLAKLDTDISTQIESKEKLAKFDKFSKLVHKKISEKYSAAELKDLSEEQLKAKMEEMAGMFEHDPDVSDFWEKSGKDMAIPNDLQQWMGLAGTAGFMVGVASEGKTGFGGMNSSSSAINKLSKGIGWGILAAVATHPVFTNLLAYGMRKTGKNILYPTASVAARTIDKVAFGGIIDDPVGSIKEIWTGKDNAERAHDKMVMNYASGQAEVMTQYAGKEIKGWQAQIEEYKSADATRKETIAGTLIPETAEFVAKSMPQFLGPVESEQVVRAIEAGNVNATSLSRYSAMIFSGNYFKFFLKEASPEHRQQFLDEFKKQRESIQTGYTTEELKNKFSGISGDGLKLNKMLKKSGIRKALSKPGSSLLAIYLSIWAVMRLAMGTSNTLFNKQWWSDKWNSKAVRGLGKVGATVAIPITEIDKMKKGFSKNKIIDRFTIKRNKKTRTSEGFLSKKDAKKWKKELSSRDDRKVFVENYKKLMIKESTEGKKTKKDVAEVSLEDLQACLPEGVRKELYPEDKDKKK